jgi:aerobic-type carbon monoxide dehydrogenase small subunit (CoxS/CutS family)
MRIELELDGVTQELDVAPGATLLEALRDAGVAAVKDGCSRGDCGTCAVLLDGRAVTSCTLFAAQAHGHEVRTAAGFADLKGLHPLQAALIDAGGVQCGFCTPGVLAAAMELLEREPDPTEAEVRTALAGNLCRCTGYVRIVDGVLAAAALLREGDDD